MRLRYDREQDILLMEVSDEVIDYAEEVGPIIVHFTEAGCPVLLEIMDASEFLTQATKVTMKSAGEYFIEIPV